MTVKNIEYKDAKLVCNYFNETPIESDCYLSAKFDTDELDELRIRNGLFDFSYFICGIVENNILKSCIFYTVPTFPTKTPDINIEFISSLEDDDLLINSWEILKNIIIKMGFNQQYLKINIQVHEFQKSVFLNKFLIRNNFINAVKYKAKDNDFNKYLTLYSLHLNLESDINEDQNINFTSK